MGVQRAHVVLPPDLLEKIDAVAGPRGGSAFLVETVNVAEIYAGMRTGEATKSNLLLSSLLCYPITEAIGRQAGLLRAEWSKRGRTFSQADMMIAATALEHGLS